MKNIREQDDLEGFGDSCSDMESRDAREDDDGAQSGEISVSHGGLGDTERRLIASLVGDMPRLEYKTHSIKKANGKVVEVYDIPQEDRQKMLEELYIFEPPVHMDDEMYDLHEGRMFCVKDYMVVREDGGNFLVSPYYPKSGGTMLDWMPPEVMEAEEGMVRCFVSVKKGYGPANPC